MRKSFISVMLWGALIIAPLTMFVSCDYDDDIDNLQEQIDANASSASAELQEKINLLEAQIAALTTSNTDLEKQLEAAKTEMAAKIKTAQETAEAAAAAADAKATAAQGSADAAAAAAVAAQKTADTALESAKTAIANVAVLEAKISAANEAIAELKAAKEELSKSIAEINVKIADLNTALATLSTKSGAQYDELVKECANLATTIAANKAALEAEITRVSGELGAKIDAIMPEVNKLLANYATASDVEKKYNELITLTTQMQQQISANTTYYNELKAYYESLSATVDTKADKAAVDAAIAALESSKANVSDLENLKNYYEQLNDYYVTLKAAVDTKADAATVAAALDTKANATDVEELKGYYNELKSLYDALKAAVDAKADAAAIAESINAINTSIGVINSELSAINAKLETKADASAVQALAESVSAQINTLNEAVAKAATKEELTAAKSECAANLSTAVAGLEATINSVKSELESKIDAAIAQAQTFANEALAAAKGYTDTKVAEAITTLNASIEALGTTIRGEISVAKQAAIAEANTYTDTEIANKLADYSTSAEVTAEIQAAITNAIGNRFDEYYTKSEIDTKMKAVGKASDSLKVSIDSIFGELNILKAAIKANADNLAALLARTQSIVFVPEYRGITTAYDQPVVPAYYYDGLAYGALKECVISPKFRVQPIENAQKIVDILNSGKLGDYLSIEFEDEALTTRSTVSVTPQSVELVNGSFIRVFASVPELNLNAPDNLFTATLAIGDSVSKQTITSDYFVIEQSPIQLANLYLNKNIIEIPYTSNKTIIIKDTATMMGEIYSTAVELNIENWGIDSKLELHSIYVPAVGGYVAVEDSKITQPNVNNATRDARNAYITWMKDTQKSFNVDLSKGTISIAKAVDTNIGQTVSFLLRESAFGYSDEVMKMPNETRQITFRITPSTETLNFPFADIAQVWAGDKAAFSLKWDGDKALPITQWKATSGVLLEDQATIETQINTRPFTWTVQDATGAIIADETTAAPTVKPIIKANTTTHKVELTVEFAESVKYQKYTIVAETDSKDGKIIYMATIDLSYPNDFLTHEAIRWSDKETFFVNAGNLPQDNTTGDLISNEMKKGYTKYETYTGLATSTVEYVWELIEYPYSTSPLRTSPYTGINLSTDGQLTLTSKVENAKLSDPFSFKMIRVKVLVDGHEVKNIDGVQTGTEDYTLKVNYPIPSNALTSEDYVFTGDEVMNNPTFNISTKTEMKDSIAPSIRNILIHNGVASSTAGYAAGTPYQYNMIWGINETQPVKYTILSAKAAGNDVAPGTLYLSQDGSDLHLVSTQKNLTNDIVITVGMETIGYTYGTIKGEFTVTLSKTE